jgi:hypothetical protein
MRTTLRIDDDLLRQLKAQALREDVPLTEVVNRMIRRGMEVGRVGQTKAKRAFRQRTFSMGTPRFDVNKAMAFAASLEDEEILNKLAQRK